MRVVSCSCGGAASGRQWFGGRVRRRASSQRWSSATVALESCSASSSCGCWLSGARSWWLRRAVCRARSTRGRSFGRGCGSGILAVVGIGERASGAGEQASGCGNRVIAIAASTRRGHRNRSHRPPADRKEEPQQKLGEPGPDWRTGATRQTQVWSGCRSRVARRLGGTRA